jgi:tRNA pseudouridine55 synthase
MKKLPPLLLIDKPKGISSFTVIRKLRRLTGIRKMGHAGTLDPLASGLMLIGVEKGTKSIADLVGLDKEYVAEVLIGEKRSTGDMEGEVLMSREYASDITKEKILEELTSLVGELMLPVSAYSAIKKDGVPMYKRARSAEKKGEVVEDVPKRAMKVYEAELLKIKEVKSSKEKRLLVVVRFKVGSGTYVRSLGEELGRRLGYPATLANLRRTKVGEYKVEEAKQIEDFGNKWQKIQSKIRKLFGYY